MEVGGAQPLDQDRHDAHRGVGVLLQPFLEFLAGNGPQAGGFQGFGGGAVGGAVDHPHLAQQLERADHRDPHRNPVRTGLFELDAAGFDQKNRVAGLALAEDHRPPIEAALACLQATVLCRVVT